MSITTTLTPAQTVAINKAITQNTDALRHNNEDAITHSGSVAVIVDYSFKISADEEYTPTISTPYKAVLALLAEQSPAMAEAVMNAMNTALTLKADAQSGDESAEAKLKGLMKDAPKATEDINAQLQALPKSTRQGKVHGVSVEVTSLNSLIAKTAISKYAQQQAEKAIEEAEMLKKAFA
tara:strand:+ start:715 stop:1254 length:540 start_codon:yes stop_codon:yes gene_type:complete